MFFRRRPIRSLKRFEWGKNGQLEPDSSSSRDGRKFRRLLKAEALQFDELRCVGHPTQVTSLSIGTLNAVV
jgi:hypothetical protein